MSAHIIAIINQKGGCGKTTTAAALGAGLHGKGHRVLYIDLDAGNLSQNIGGQRSGAALDLLRSGEIDREQIQRTAYGDLIAADQYTATAETLLNEPGAEMHMREALQEIRGGYDYILIDNPPTLGRRSANALTAADAVIIPTMATPNDLQGAGQLYQTIRAAQKYTNADLRILGVLITNYEGRGKLQRGYRETAGAMAEAMNTELFPDPIPHTTEIQKAQARQISIYEQAPKSKAAGAYAAAVDHIENYMKGR